MYLEVSPYKEILAGIEAALAIDEGVITLTGPEGSGKTSLAYQLSGTLQQRGAQVVFFLHAPRTPDDLQTGVLRQLHLRERGNFTRRLTEYLQSLATGNRVLHVLIDNAEQMNQATLDALRVLPTIQDDSRSLVRVVLLGSPKLDERLAPASLPAFAPQPGHRFQLQPLQSEQLRNFCGAYWRNKQVERAPPDDRWLQELLKLSGGLPGAVLAELGDEEHRHEINIRARLAQAVVEEREAARQPLKPARTSARGAGSGLRLLLLPLLLAAVAFSGYRYLQRPAPQVAVESLPAPASMAAVQTAAPPADARGTPAPAAADATVSVPAPAPVAAVTAEEPALSREEEAGIIADAEVVRLLNAWVQNWQAQNLPGYFACYGTAFMPESFDSRAAWEDERRRIISAAKAVSIGWRELQIRARNEESMLIELWLDYRSATYADRTLKELTLGFENGRAVILRERNLTVQP